MLFFVNLIHISLTCRIWRGLCQNVYYTLFAFLEAVDQNPFLWFSQKTLIAAIIGVFLVSFALNCILVFSTFRDKNDKNNNIKMTASRIPNGG